MTNETNKPSAQNRVQRTEKSRLGPIALTRNLIRAASEVGAVSLGYHVSGLFQSMSATMPRVHFPQGERLSYKHIPPNHAEVIGRCHEFIKEEGNAIILSNYLELFAKVEPELTEEIMSAANGLGVHDQFMVPVFGPYDINGMISFGFPERLSWERDQFLVDLEQKAVVHHTRILQHYGKKKRDIELSERENDVLNWIARGKSSWEIAKILEISRSSVDTYTRRIYEKMGVHDRVSATVHGIKNKYVSFDE